MTRNERKAIIKDVRYFAEPVQIEDTIGFEKFLLAMMYQGCPLQPDPDIQKYVSKEYSRGTRSFDRREMKKAREFWDNYNGTEPKEKKDPREKTCKRCGTTKSLDQFYKIPSRTSNNYCRNICKECDRELARERARKRKLANRERELINKIKGE